MDYISHIRSLVGHEKVIMVVAGAFVFDDENRLLLQQRADNGQWGIPGGFMEFNETVQETARREVFEETGIKPGKLELFGIYSGKDFDKTFANGDQVYMVQIIFTCRDFVGELKEKTEESMRNDFFPLDALPTNIFTSQTMFFEDYFSDEERPIIR
ncbi:NUDIX hydrolase [Bacillus marinisedimentorum]|uniref:NUDIX hydrolase n=1 Tax=Bacillus marinisedimentorum TaxID=1821260 RepID=UPI00087312C4|nr:NUDIX hydrolase [Bacillus marinisedimentorum]